jgi:4-amino-4-deoxy-L-arabinose transferase-like glycosyltransferase
MRMSRDRFLWLILAVGAFVRFWHIQGDLPYVLHYDEPTLVDNAVWMLQHGTMNPRFFHYPSGLIMLLALLYGIVCAGGVVIGQFAGWTAAITWLASGTYPQPEGGGVLYFYPTIGVPALYLIGRGVSALAGTVTVGLVYLLVARVGASKATARTAALFMALSPLAVENSHLITTDMTAAAVATAALLVCVSLAQGLQRNPTQATGKREVAAGAQGSSTRSWTVAGALAGLAAGVKYSAGSVALLLPLLALRDWRSTGRLGLGRLGLATAAAVAAFLVTTPFALLDASRFARDLGYEFHHIASVTPAIEQGDLPEASSLGKVASVFWHDLGIVGILAALIGAIVSLRSENRGRAWIAVWVLVFLLPLLRWKTLYPRYLLPAWPAVLTLAALGVEGSVRWIARLPRIPTRAHRATAIFAAGLVLAPGTVRLTTREARRTRPDPRIEMTRWLDANVPKGERIVTEKGGPFPDPTRYSIQVVDFLGLTPPGEHVARGVRYLVATGRERLVSGANARAAIVRGLEAIRESSDVVWSRDRYAILRLRGEGDWETPVRQAIAAKDLLRAREILEKQAASGAGTSHLWKTLGEVRAGLGDTTAAIAAYEQAGRRDSTDVEIRLVLSSLHLASHRWDEALVDLERALRVSPRETLIYHNLAVLRLYRAQDRLRAGDRASARTEWDAARAAARVCARAAPSDEQMTGVLDQVERMGARWGFAK